VGFEPTDTYGSPVFKTGAFNRSAIPPLSASRLDPIAFRHGAPNIANTSV
jgi:hypothetical protein